MLCFRDFSSSLSCVFLLLSNKNILLLFKKQNVVFRYVYYNLENQHEFVGNRPSRYLKQSQQEVGTGENGYQALFRNMVH